MTAMVSNTSYFMLREPLPVGTTIIRANVDCQDGNTTKFNSMSYIGWQLHNIRGKQTVMPYQPAGSYEIGN
jgi:hypothetical protein